MDVEVTAREATAPDPIVAVALTPGEIPTEQRRLIAWCHAKIHALNVERSDFLDNALIAREHKWQYASLEAAAQRARNRMIYYEKLAAALEAGYLIVPNFDVDVMAVRVRETRKKPYPHSDTGNWVNLPDVSHDAHLPVGDGKYVDERAFTQTTWETRKKSDGTTEQVRRVTASGLDPTVDFPVLAVKPRIMDATARAMALKVFDDIGVVTGRKRDPVVVGRIFQPGRGRWGIVSFFIAWWVDSKALEV